jgi:hypothetical protein
MFINLQFTAFVLDLLLGCHATSRRPGTTEPTNDPATSAPIPIFQSSRATTHSPNNELDASPDPDKSGMSLKYIFLSVRKDQEILRDIRNGNVPVAIKKLKSLSGNEIFDKQFWEKVVSFLLGKLNSDSTENRCLIRDYLSYLMMEPKYSDMISRYALKCLKRGDRDYGVKELLELVPLNRWDAMDESVRFDMLIKVFPKLLLVESFGSFGKMFLRHVSHLLDSLKSYLKNTETVSKLRDVFYCGAEKGDRSVAIIKFYSLLSDYLNIADAPDYMSTFESLLPSSLLSWKHYRKMMAKLCASFTLTAFQSKYIEFVHSDEKHAIEIATFKDLNLKEQRGEWTGHFIVESVMSMMKSGKYPELKALSTIIQDMEDCDVYADEEELEAALRMAYDLSSQTDEAAHPPPEVIQVLAMLFGDLSISSQLRHLSSFIDLFIATNNVNLLEGLAVMFENTNVKGSQCAQLSSTLFYKVIDRIDDVGSMIAMFRIMTSVLSHIPEPQYQRILLKLATSKLDHTSTSNEPTFRYSLCLTCLVRRPVKSEHTMNRLNVPRLIGQPCESEIYEAAVSRYRGVRSKEDY